MPEYEFFISYTAADRQWAEWIAWQLEADGLRTVIQAWDFSAGCDFVEEMQRAATQATRTIAVLSPAYFNSRFGAAEWHAAFAGDPVGHTRKLIPVRVRECDVEGVLSVRVYVDLANQQDATAARAELLKHIRAAVAGTRTKPETEPAFPGGTPSAPISPANNAPRFPNTLPPVWNLTQRRNPNFIGRDELLRELEAALDTQKSAALTQAITGLGGVGKTQLALEFAHRRHTAYDVVWWVRAEEAVTLSADLGALAAAVGLPEAQSQDLPAKVAAVRQWLAQTERRWLLIFDNAKSAAQLREALPPGGAGHVLITSRDPNWRGTAQPLSVKVLAPDDARDFLLRRTGQDDATAAAALADELDGLPLALEQAGAFIEQKGLPMGAYLRLFRTRQQELLQRGETSPDYPHTVATTWELAFQAVREQQPAGADLLNLFAFLAPDDIRHTLLTAGAAHLPATLAAAVRDELSFEDAVEALRRYSLVERDARLDAFNVHRLVQVVTRHRLSDAGRRMWAETAVQLLADAFPGGNVDQQPETWETCSQLLEHALAVAEYAEALQLAQTETAYLLNQAALFQQWILADYKQAKGGFERSLLIAEVVFGLNHPQVATRLNNLGLILQDLGDLPGALVFYERALRIDETAFGPDHPEVARDVNNLGEVLRVLGDLPSARGQFERARGIWEAAYGQNHPNMAVVANNLGLVLKALGNLPGALMQYEQALRIDEAVFGLNHPSVAIDVNNLGGLLVALGELNGARGHYERALRILCQFLAEDHPAMVTVRKNLEWVLQRLSGADAAPD